MSFHALDESEFAADPITQYRHWYAEAQARMGVAADSLVVATADARGVPSARIVLLRGVTDEGFMFFTNYESAKGRDLAENPRAALVSHWHDLDRQVRVKGRVAKAAEAESVAYLEQPAAPEPLERVGVPPERDGRQPPAARGRGRVPTGAFR